MARALAKNKGPDVSIRSVRLLGNNTALSFSQDDGGLKIKLPAEKPGNYAYVFRIEKSK